MEVKTASGMDWYLPCTQRGVERRVKKVIWEYGSDAKKADIKYYQTDQGPFTRRLEEVGPVYAMAWGRLGEASNSVHKLVEVIAAARVKQQNMACGRGEEREKGDRSKEVALVRRRLSVASTIAFGQRLAGRMAQVAGGGGQNAALAKGRRQQWRKEEEWARREREAAWLDRVSAREVVTRGRL